MVTDAPHPFTLLNDLDLNFTHLALRVYAKYPGLSTGETAEATRLADIAWGERVRRSAREPGTPAAFGVTETLRKADRAASVAHDFIHGKNGVTKDEASAAVWTVHDALRPLLEVGDLDARG